ncbi:MAG: formyltransferase [Betaproteobacteria bacterium]|nr:formyltransferase [Betaproteobacteria bacterium]
MTSAVVFAYHNVGVACLRVLLKQGIEVKRVVTHADSPTENIWFESVAELARESGIPVSIVDDPNSDEYIADIAALKPDFLFSFYYRQMLAPALLRTAPRGAFNMHGSLLPKYRGRVPINWAIIKGETETGATLHEMVAKPDAGRIIDQERVAILPDDTALDVFTKVTGAAAIVLSRSLPKLIDGTATPREQYLAAGSYFGGRKPEDGIINWHDSAQNIHNLVRAVAPPYPGATTALNGESIKIVRTRLAPAHFQHHNPAKLNVGSDTVIALCGDGRMLRIVESEIDGQPHNEVMLAARLGIGLYDLDSTGEEK